MGGEASKVWGADLSTVIPNLSREHACLPPACPSLVSEFPATCCCIIRVGWERHSRQGSMEKADRTMHTGGPLAGAWGLGLSVALEPQSESLTWKAAGTWKAWDPGGMREEKVPHPPG